MALPLWGELEKAQDNDQTIDEAIAVAIADHNDDPTAHLGSGQSLEAHKTDPVVDHPQGSVLADKWTHSELDFETTFENLDAFVDYGSVSQIWPGFYAEGTGTGVANRGGLLIDGESGGLPFDTTKTMLVQFSFNIDGGSDDLTQLRMGPYSFSSPTWKAGMGVQIEGDELTFFVGDDDGSDVNESDPQTINYLQTYIVRMFNNTTTGKIECYLDGTLIDELDWPTGDYSEYANVFMWTWTTSGGTAVLHVKSLYFSLQP